ncbi:MAG TPA: GH1 family beta-glucosidase [Gaiellaceae bacterium]|nr:GH1 family beta-glucosidase [Gaiellaceae bacterium]
MSHPVFPEGFVWGAAASAYQVEGAVTEDGRGESIWDRFATQPGAISNGDTGVVACDSYHRFGEDLRLLRELGISAYRFSISWPRIVPDGRGRVNPAGLDFYERIVDELLANDIEPYVTLYHWDLPQALEDAGGWPARDTVEAFTEYVEAVAARLGDRVSNWITQNEPWVVSWLGYGLGIHAPGRRSPADALAAAHHVLLGHGRAAEVLRREAPRARVGVTVDLYPVYPETDSDADSHAARLLDGSRNRWFLEPVLGLGYPADMLEHYRAILPAIEEGDLDTIGAPLDFLGVNYYSRAVVRAGTDPGAPVQLDVPGVERTQMGWEVYPEGLKDLLVRMQRDYELPDVYITENGAAYPDTRTNGSVADPSRISYLERHLGALRDAISEGVPVRGYFLWSLLDNFEWAFGFSRRFGIVYVDFDTLERVPKDSFLWYRDLIAAQSASGV